MGVVNLEHEAPYKFNRRLAMQLWEKDKNSKDDDLGLKMIDAKPTSGVVTAHFNKRPGADYTISYVVR